jgi:hypothetical protein
VGDRVPEEIDNPDKVASLEVRVTVIVYTEVVVPSWAVTRTSIVLEPTFNDKAPDADPDVTGVNDPEDPRRTPIVAFAWFLVGVTVIEAVEFVTVVE